jgi:hypothetical protein
MGRTSRLKRTFSAAKVCVATVSSVRIAGMEERVTIVKVTGGGVES